MKQSNLSFADGFLGVQASAAKSQGATHKAFDWAKAAEIIKDRFAKHPDLIAEAGLQGDWNYTAGAIFEDGKPKNDGCYLCSNWATPTLILTYDGDEQEEIDCSTDKSDRFDSHSTWDAQSIAILGINE